VSFERRKQEKLLAGTSKTFSIKIEGKAGTLSIVTFANHSTCSFFIQILFPFVVDEFQTII
jgi:hypothetical protein